MEQEIENNLCFGNRDDIFTQRKSTLNNSKASEFEKFAAFYLENSLVSQESSLYKEKFNRVLKEVWIENQNEAVKENFKVKETRLKVKKMLIKLAMTVGVVSIFSAFSYIFFESSRDVFILAVVLFMSYFVDFLYKTFNASFNFMLRHMIYFSFVEDIEEKLEEFNTNQSLKDVGINKPLMSVPGE